MSTRPRVAFVTGASRGIGRAIATHLASRAYRVAAAARSASELEMLAAETGALALPLDVTDAAAVEPALARADAELEGLDLLVANAGVAGDGTRSWEQEPAAWWRVFEVNVLGAYLAARAAIPRMRAHGGGRIVLVASRAAFFPLAASDAPISSAYMASKAALLRFAEALADEASDAGIVVLAISPGLVRTAMTTRVFGDLRDDPDRWSPPSLTAELVEFIDSGALDRLSGRHVHAVRDDWRTLPARIDEIVASDSHALRVVED